jgi:hypothetical protein
MALRRHHAIRVYSDQRRATARCLNVTEASRVLGVSAHKLRRAIEHAELTAEYSRPDLWIFRHDVLTTEDAKMSAARASFRSRRSAVPTERRFRFINDIVRGAV